MNKPLMSLILSGAMLTALTGCNQPQKQGDASEGTTTTTAQSPAAVAAPGTTAQSPVVGSAPSAPDQSGVASLADVKAAAGKDVVEGKHVRIETTKGEIEVVMFPEAAPKTVENFLTLAKSGFYDGTTFHRVIPGFVSQGGDPLSKTLQAGDPRIGTGGAKNNIPDEFGGGLKHLPGSLAMAHSSMPNSASSQFYIGHVALPSLDGKYAVFGQVVKGFDVVKKLNATDKGGAPDKMTKVTVIE